MIWQKTDDLCQEQQNLHSSRWKAPYKETRPDRKWPILHWSSFWSASPVCRLRPRPSTHPPSTARSRLYQLQLSSPGAVHLDPTCSEPGCLDLRSRPQNPTSRFCQWRQPSLPANHIHVLHSSISIFQPDSFPPGPEVSRWATAWEPQPKRHKASRHRRRLETASAPPPQPTEILESGRCRASVGAASAGYL